MAIEVFAQECTITGQVFDAETKESIPGVPILIKGTSKGVSTDIDGYFTIKTKIGAQLYFKYLNYDAQEITITEKLVSLSLNKNSKNGFSIWLKTNPTHIEDVIVLGYVNQKAGTSTEATDVVSEKVFRTSTSSNIDQTLQGHAGMSVTTSGSPGACSQVILRGPGTINNSDPLYVLDGIPQSASPRLNSSDIKSVTILKDASACAMYGSRGANGVIVITTKGGVIKKQAEEKTYQYRSDRSYKGTLFVVDSLIIDTVFDFKAWGFKKRQVDHFYLEKQKNGLSYVFMDTKPIINNTIKNISTDMKEWVLKHPHCAFSINDSVQPSKATVIHALNSKTIKKINSLGKTEAVSKYGKMGEMGVLEIEL
jgi:TonB-dependent SusC/RagA subfamily outer membrane receptor